MRKTFLVIGTFSMALAVALGALGAHALREVLEPQQLDAFTTAVRYQVWHALALISVQCIPTNLLSEKAARTGSFLMVVGTLLFSFSIYLLSLRDLLGLPEIVSVLGPITPLGGLLLIGSWLWLALSFRRTQSVKSTP